MPDMTPKKNEMPVQPADIRNKNFDEVALGYSAETAVAEAKRCLNCKHKPCVSGCPVQINIPEFIQKVAEGDFEAAYEIIYKSSSLPAVCGRVCPQERQCEAKCVRGIKGEPVAIGRLERFVADWHMQNSKTTKTAETPQIGKKVDEGINYINNNYTGVAVDKYVIMPNHIHLIIEINDDDNNRAVREPPLQYHRSVIDKMVGFFKMNVSKKIHITYSDKIWQRSYHDHIIRGENDYQKIWEYIDTNPLKWELDCFYNDDNFKVNCPLDKRVHPCVLLK